MASDRTQADSEETIQVGAMGVRFLVEAADSNGSVSVFECFVPADSRMPAPHRHDAFEETIYGLEGVTSWTVDGRAARDRCRRRLLRPPGRRPRIPEPRRRGREVPGGRQPGIMRPDYFREIHEVLTASGGGPPDPAKLHEVMRRHGLTPAPPA